MNKRTGLARFQSGIWKTRCKWRDGEKTRSPLCNEEENEIRICLALNGTQMEGKILE
jgi:hypothetical protein